MLRHHIFVCRNSRPTSGRTSCESVGAAEVFAALVSAISSNPDLCATTVVTECGCLGLCGSGPVVVVYPDAIWYAKVAVTDVARIVSEHLVAGRPVESLRFEP